MSPILPTVVLAVLATSLSAQVVQIPAMTIPSTRVDVDSLPAGATTLTAIRRAGSPYGAQIAALTLTANSAAQGFYNWNTQGGEGLARDPVTNALAVIAPGSFFNAFDATIDLQVEGNEFGFSVGDWSGGMIVQFRRRSDNSLVAQFATSLFTSTAVKFFRSTQPFDRVVLRADSADGNWLLTEFHIASNVPWESIGAGCAGSNGTPTLSTTDTPRLNQAFDLDINGMPTTGGIFLMTLGLSTTFDPGLGSLPFELGVIGASGCNVLASLDQSFFSVQTTGSSTFSIAIPADPVFLGVRFANQAFASDTVNALGFVASNAGLATIQP